MEDGLCWGDVGRSLCGTLLDWASGLHARASHPFISDTVDSNQTFPAFRCARPETVQARIEVSNKLINQSDMKELTKMLAKNLAVCWQEARSTHKACGQPTDMMGA